MRCCRLIGSLVLIAGLSDGPSEVQAEDPAVQVSPRGELRYAEDASGDRVPDFSRCGYAEADHNIPDVPVRIVVEPGDGDDTQRIQSAIDRVASLPIDNDGLRGAVRLAPGEFQIDGQIRIRSSGVVVQGSGADASGTLLRATGVDRRALVSILGIDDRRLEESRETTDGYVPVGAVKMSLRSTAGLSVGDVVVVTRASSREWIDRLDCRELYIGWKPGSRDIQWERKITSIDGNQITLDAPITCSIDRQFAASTVQRLTWPGRLQHVGIEDVQLVSSYARDRPTDEDHAWFGIRIDCAKHAWARRIVCRHFAGSAVMLGRNAHSVTVEDCMSVDPISELGGYRRHTFFTLGQLGLFHRCWSENGRHDFSAGHCAAGPNAFVQCRAKNAHGASGPIESWAAGVLYDNVRIDGNDLRLENLWNSPPGAGWSAANCVLWQCRAAHVHCSRPPGENNWAIGCWATHAGDGKIESINDFVKPHSLYQMQLLERVGNRPAQRLDPFLGRPRAATNPTYQEAALFVQESARPAPSLVDLIKHNIKTSAERRRADLERFDSSVKVAQKPPRESQSDDTSHSEARRDKNISIRNGWIVGGSRLATGDRFDPAWWRGTLRTQEAAKMGINVTRLAPGRSGDGLTNDLQSAIDRLEAGGFVSYEHHYGLWYDRRRDDHLMVRRRDGNVLPPFYEQPFRRTGQGVAWDGLSKYDLTADNPWYWNRLRQFAKLCDQRGLVLFHHNYFQHNILEAGAHWVDSPWRPANNVNDTHLPEPPHFIGDKRIFMAKHFYDVSNPQLRELHRRYIRQCLNAFVGCSNVVQLTSAEYTGPLHFTKFWLDVIQEWRKEGGNNALIALSCTKDVQDAILADPAYRHLVDIIDIRYWTLDKNFELYAPSGGRNLAPRQHLRQLKPEASSFASIVEAVRQYRSKYPHQAILYNADRACRSGRDGWAVLMGGGSLPDVKLPPEVAATLANMRPTDNGASKTGHWQLSSPEGDVLAYTASLDDTLEVQLPDGPTTYQVVWIDADTGETVNREKLRAAGTLELTPQANAVWVARVAE